jgi:hypothetical protein
MSNIPYLVTSARRYCSMPIGALRKSNILFLVISAQSGVIAALLWRMFFFA